MLKRFFVLCIVVVLSGCSVKQEAINKGNDKIEMLAQDLMALGKNVDKKEAYHFAKEALSYPRVLAKQYDLATPATYHNMLIHLGYRKRGLCFHWTEDMMAHLKKQNYKSFDLRWAVSDKGGEEEHNSVVAVAKGAPFESGILIDPWRNSGDLYWGKMPLDEKFKWVENKKRTIVLGTVKK